MILDSIIWLSVTAGQLNWRTVQRTVSLFYTFVFFLPSMHSHSNFLHFFWSVWGLAWLVGFFSFRKLFDSLWVFNISFFPQTYVKLHRGIKVNIFYF